MKIKEVIDRLNEWSNENLMPEDQVLRLINELEKLICNDILYKRITDIEYTEHESVNDDCLLPDEYTDMYVNYILSCAYARKYESDRAAQHTALFNNLYNSYGNYVIRTYPPKECAKITI